MAAIKIQFKARSIVKSVITNYVNWKEYGGLVPPALLEMIFDDLITLLRFSYRSDKEGLLSGGFFFTSNIEYLDLMWHHFILHTDLYVNFCKKEFGEYLHHFPEPPPKKSRRKRKNSLDVAQLVENQMRVLEEDLGTDFVNRIYFIYPELLKGS